MFLNAGDAAAQVGVPLIVGAYFLKSFQSVVSGPGRHQLSPCLEEVRLWSSLGARVAQTEQQTDESFPCGGD